MRRQITEKAGELLWRYYAHGIGRQSAAIAYYLLFSVFPLLIFLSAVLGLLRLNPAEVLKLLSNILPQAFLSLAEEYLIYVTQNSNAAILSFALVFTIYFPARAVGALQQGIRLAYGAERQNLWHELLRLLLYMLFLMAAVLMTCITILSGGQGFLHLQAFLPAGLLLPLGRLLLPGGILLASAVALYQMALPRASLRKVLPGALFALIAWIASSRAFSAYVEYSGRYSLLYGSIAAIMVTLIWLWLSAVTLLMGAELNAVLSG